MKTFKQKEWANLISQCLAYLEQQTDFEEIKDLFSEKPCQLPDLKEKEIYHYAYVMRSQFGSSGPQDGYSWKPSQGARVAGNGKSMKRYFYHKSEDLHVKKQVFWNIASPQWTWLDYRSSDAPNLIEVDNVSSPPGINLKKLIQLALDSTESDNVDITPKKRTTRVTKKPEPKSPPTKRDCNGNNISHKYNNSDNNGSGNNLHHTLINFPLPIKQIASIATSDQFSHNMQPLPHPAQKTVYRPTQITHYGTETNEPNFDNFGSPSRDDHDIFLWKEALSEPSSPFSINSPTSSSNKSPYSPIHFFDDYYFDPNTLLSTESNTSNTLVSHHDSGSLFLLSPPMSPSSNESGFFSLIKSRKTENNNNETPFQKFHTNETSSFNSGFTPSSVLETANSMFETASSFFTVPVEFLMDKVCHSLCTQLIFKRDFFLRTGIDASSLLEKVKQQTYSVDFSEFPGSMMQNFFNWLCELSSNSVAKVPQHYCLVCGQVGSHNGEKHNNFYAHLDVGFLTILKGQNHFNFYELVKQLLTWLLRNPSQHKDFQYLFSQKLYCPFCAGTNGAHDLEKHQRWKDLWGITAPPLAKKEESSNPEDYSQKAFEWIVGKNWELPMYIGQTLLSLNYFKSFVNCLELLWKTIYLV